MPGIKTRFVDLTGTTIKNLISNVALGSTKKSQQNCCQYAKQKLMGESHKINKRTSGFLVCQVIISLAKRFSSKFHICPQSLAS